jgi:hypothetical protein
MIECIFRGCSKSCEYEPNKPRLCGYCKEHHHQMCKHP